MKRVSADGMFPVEIIGKLCRHGSHVAYLSSNFDAMMALECLGICRGHFGAWNLCSLGINLLIRTSKYFITSLANVVAAHGSEYECHAKMLSLTSNLPPISLPYHQGRSRQVMDHPAPHTLSTVLSNR